MALSSLQVYNFRNLAQQTVQFGPSLNIVFGSNGSGKTSLLEAIYVLSNGKSFRTSRTKTIVSSHSEDDSIIVRGNYLAEGRDTSAAIKKTPSEAYLAKLNGETVNGIAKLAKISPTLVLEPRSFDLLQGGPSYRRKFLDWGVFHVEHEFSDNWKRYISCLKQRNSLLRSGRIEDQLFHVWEQGLAQAGELITESRTSYFTSLVNEFDNLKHHFISAEIINELSLSFYAGWDTSEYSLQEHFKNNREKDLRRTQTGIGPHRADLRINYKGRNASEGLSRGQQKLLIITLYLANVIALKKRSDKSSVLLFDDVAAELDNENLSNTMRTLLDTDAQIICTALELEDFADALKDYKEKKVFHVEHGLVSLFDHSEQAD